MRTTIAIALVVMVGCSSARVAPPDAALEVDGSTAPAPELFVGPLRELWDDGRADRREPQVAAELVNEGESASLTIDGCTVALRRVSAEDAPRRFVLAADQEACAAGLVEQALVGDPVRRDPTPPGAALDVEMWITRADGEPSLVAFTGARAP